VSDGVVSHFGKIEADKLANLKQFNTVKKPQKLNFRLNSADVCVSHEQSTLVTIDYLYHLALLMSIPIFEYNEPLHYNNTVYDYVNCDYNIS